MLFLRGLAFASLAAIGIGYVSAFVNNDLSHVSQHQGGSASASITARTTHIQQHQLQPPLLRRQRSFGALRLAEGNADDAMAAAREQAEKLKEQAAALREEASSAEMAIGRNPATAAAEDAPEPTEDMLPRKIISDNMKARLTRELESQGANPNKSAGNPILVVAAIVGLLVIVGGQGIFY